MGLFSFFSSLGKKQTAKKVVKKVACSKVMQDMVDMAKHLVQPTQLVVPKMEPLQMMQSETIETVTVETEPQVVPGQAEPSTKKFPGLCVALDPGHAKTTGGKRSPYSLGKLANPVLPFEEWAFNRDIVERVILMLNKLGIETYVTTDAARDGVTDVNLTARASRAWNFIKGTNKKGLFVSVHANAHGNGSDWTSARGWCAYTTKGQNISDDFAECMYDAAEATFKAKGMTIRTNKADGDRDWEENFTVIYKTEQFSKQSGKVTVPCVLVENFFYTNIEDTTYLNSDEGRNDIAKVTVNAIIAYAEKFYKM